jgi:NADH-quinone oxidoreductase subunit E
MLSETERTEIEAELRRYPDRQGGCIDALRIVQKHRGWVSDEGIRDVAGSVGISRHEVDAVATFYNLIYRRPVGRHVIHVCDSVSCWVMGCDRVCERLQQILGIGWGETTGDGRFTLLPIPCLGACDQAPAMLLGGDLHVGLTPETIERTLEGKA